MGKFPPALLPLAAASWFLLLLAAPAALDPSVAPVAAVAVYQASSIVCHQETDRSFKLSGIQLPVCGRCLGLYAAAAGGAVLAWLFGRRRAAPAAAAARAMLAVAAAPLLLSVVLEVVGLIDGSNVSRFLSGLPFGAAAGWVLQRVAAAPGAETMRYDPVDTTI